MQNVLTVHGHDTKSNHCHIAKTFICSEFFALNNVVLDLLSQAPPIGILHDNVDAVVFDERFHELYQCGALKYT
jgi:hypothetical protein